MLHKEKHRVYSLKAHIVLVTKYRQDIIVDDIKDNLIDIIYSIARYNDFQILEINSDKNHVHILIDYSIHSPLIDLITIIKKYTAIEMWKRHSYTLSYVYYKERTFFHDGSFCCSVGDSGEEVVRQYIRDQGL